MQGAATLIDFQEEIKSKQSYVPTATEFAYDQEVFKEFEFDLAQHQKTHKFLGGLNITDYIRRNQLDYTYYVPKLKDPFDWHSHIHSTVQMDKVNALVAFFQDLNFKCEVSAQDWLDRISSEMADVAETLLQNAEILDNGEEKNRLADISMFVDGTVAEDIGWTVKWRLDKSKQRLWVPSYDENVTDFGNESEWVESFEGIESKLCKLNRIFLGDITKTDIADQPHIFKEYVMSYESAYAMFHHYYKWRFVKPWSAQTDGWTDTDLDEETEQNRDRTRLVRVRVYENTERNEYAIYLNRERMTPVGLKMPHNRFSITWTGINLSPHFAYGESLVAHMRQDALTRDILVSLFVDSGRQGLEPPLKSSFRNLISRYAFAPRAITQAQQGTLEPLLPPNAQQGFAIQAIQYLEKRISESVVNPIFMGQNNGVMKTKYEVEQAMMNAIRTASFYVNASVNRRKQRAKAFFEEILRHYPNMAFGELSEKSDKVKRFVFQGGDSSSDSEVIFQKMPEDAKTALSLSNVMRKTKKAAKKEGKNKKMFLVDSDEIKNYKYLFDFRVNPQQRSSRSFEREEIERKYMLYKQDQLIDPQFSTKMLLQANGDDPSEAIKKQTTSPQEQQKSNAAPPVASPQGMNEGMQPQQEPSSMALA